MQKILVIAGVHGCEPQSKGFARSFAKTLPRTMAPHRVGRIDDIYSILTSDQLEKNLVDLRLSNSPYMVVVPAVNPEGLIRNMRTNASGVDLNRNLPAQNWQESPKNIEDENGVTVPNPYYSGKSANSEKETQALVRLIYAGKFDLVISIHTTHFINHQTPPQINFDGPKLIDADNRHPGYIFAEQLSKETGLPLTEDIGYPTPGSLGSYCTDLGVPCLTVEFEDELSAEEIWHKYSTAFVENFF